MKNRILSIKRERDSELIATGYRVRDKMTNNPFFPAPPAALETASQLLPEFISLVGHSMNRDKEVIERKKKQKLILTSLLTEVADYVTLTCKGNRLMLLSSGFTISGKYNNREEPVIKLLKVELGPPGIATTRVKRLRGARVYIHQYTDQEPSSETAWTQVFSKDAKHTFRGLQSVKKYWFRVAAIARDGQFVYSPVVERVIQ
ncbi:hypothetical protein A3860_13080 [Niastella vici]|uniref:Fibronectin type-III domain-containing protein n=1 Tax=Niastella vici TaxID=1703345 RepID=A0A1V9G702_9BACT|nr:hypothetical protein [Niastella vici]OQP66419.1 hypothetical protein A3860_13080 [Niastella vici]